MTALNGGRSATGTLRTLDDVPTFDATHEAEYIVTGSHRCPVLVDASVRHPRADKIRVQGFAEGSGVQWVDSRKLANWRAVR